MRVLHTLTGMLVLAVCLVLVACGSNNQSQNGGAPERQSAHQQKTVDRSPAEEVIAFPDHWSNVAEKCDNHGNLLILTSNPSRMHVVEDDPRCPVKRP